MNYSLGQSGRRKTQMREKLTALPITAISANNDVLFVGSGKYLIIYRKNNLQEISRFSHFEYAINGISVSDQSVAIWSRGTLLKLRVTHLFCPILRFCKDSINMLELDKRVLYVKLSYRNLIRYSISKI